MTNPPTGLTLVTALAVAAIAFTMLPAYGAGNAAAASTVPTVRFGMDANAIAAQKSAGVAPDYATFWIGPWTLKSGWGGPDGQLTNMKNAGVTPAIHFYYWGDDISPSCVENGCWSSLHNAQKTRAGWEQLGTQLTDHLNAKMGGAPVVVFLESEFNKGGIERYEPFDGYLADMADKIHAAYPNAIIVLGFGNWGSVYWGNFDRAAAASDMVGIQGLRGSTRQDVDGMMTLYDGLLAGVKTLNAKFPGVPVMLTDIAVSSYPEPGYLAVQDDVLAEVLHNLPTLKAHGVEALIYRSWRDSKMDPANYYGQAESHWGLAWQSNGTLKPSGHTWVEAVKAERAGTTSEPTPTPTPTPAPAPTPIAVGGGVTTQAEAFATKSAGGKQSDAAADGGVAWNLWSNGHVAQTYDLAGSTDLTLSVRGTPLGGVAPHMDVYVGGAKVLSADPGRAYETHVVTVSGQGPTEVRVAFTNDAKTSSEDRNLLVDTVRLAPANRAPVAAFAVSAQGLAVQVDAAASSDPDGQPLAFAWDFGDGATATGAQAEHAYAAPGDYTVTLTASDGRAAATATRQVTAIQPNRAPAASFTATATHLTVAVDASASTDADGDALTYTWAWGDGTTSTGRTATHAYAKAGTYAILLTVGDGEAAATATKSVAVSAPTTSSSTSTTAGAAKATVTPTGNEWWIQAKVSPTATKVEAKVGSGAWTPLDKKSYGWAKSVHAPEGTPVAFRVTVNGQALTTPATAWLVDMGPLTATSTTTPTASKTTTSTAAFQATMTPKAVGNDWWVEVAVSANQPIAKVEARIDGGAWFALEKRAWGTYAETGHAPNGSKVVFRATSTSGAAATSATYTWT